MRVVRAIDLYIGDLANRGRRESTLASYERLLFKFADTLPRECLCNTINYEDYMHFLARWRRMSPLTLASGVSLLRGFSAFMYEHGYAEADVGAKLKRPRRKRPEDLDVVTVSREEVERMIAACESLQELLCIGTAIYLGARRAALARVRWGDVDLVNGTIRFVEKGGKVAVKPLPLEYHKLLALLERDNFWADPSAYLIPNRRPASVRNVERSDKVIWNTVRLVAGRAGVRSHVHALRAAFAVQFDEQHPDQLYALKELMGHDRLETTAMYLRRKDREKAMSLNRDLNWGSSVFESQAKKTSDLQGKAHTGFEPVPAESPVPDPLAAKLKELREAQRARARERRR